MLGRWCSLAPSHSVMVFSPTTRLHPLCSAVTFFSVRRPLPPRHSVMMLSGTRLLHLLSAKTVPPYVAAVFFSAMRTPALALHRSVEMLFSALRTLLLSATPEELCCSAAVFFSASRTLALVPLQVAEVLVWVSRTLLLSATPMALCHSAAVFLSASSHPFLAFPLAPHHSGMQLSSTPLQVPRVSPHQAE